MLTRFLFQFIDIPHCLLHFSFHIWVYSNVIIYILHESDSYFVFTCLSISILLVLFMLTADRGRWCLCEKIFIVKVNRKMILRAYRGTNTKDVSAENFTFLASTLFWSAFEIKSSRFFKWSSSIDFVLVILTVRQRTKSDFCSPGEPFLLLHVLLKSDLNEKFPTHVFLLRPLSTNQVNFLRFDVHLDGRTSKHFFFFQNALIKKEFDTHVDMIISIQNANNREYNASYFLRKEQNIKNKRKLMCKQRGRIQLIWWEENYKQTDSVRWICCAAFCVSV